MGTNLKSVYRFCQVFHPLLKVRSRRKGGMRRTRRRRSGGQIKGVLVYLRASAPSCGWCDGHGGVLCLDDDRQHEREDPAAPPPASVRPTGSDAILLLVTCVTRQASGQGSIVNIGSVAGVVAIRSGKGGGERRPAAVPRHRGQQLPACLSVACLLPPTRCSRLRGATPSSLPPVWGMCVVSGSIYAMTKAAMAQLSKNLACEWAQDGIRVNNVAPW